MIAEETRSFTSLTINVIAHEQSFEYLKYIHTHIHVYLSIYMYTYVVTYTHIDKTG